MSGASLPVRLGGLGGAGRMVAAARWQGAGRRFCADPTRPRPADAGLGLQAGTAGATAPAIEGGWVGKAKRCAKVYERLQGVWDVAEGCFGGLWYLGIEFNSAGVLLYLEVGILLLAAPDEVGHGTIGAELEGTVGLFDGLGGILLHGVDAAEPGVVEGVVGIEADGVLKFLLCGGVVLGFEESFAFFEMPLRLVGHCVSPFQDGLGSGLQFPPAEGV